jgi:hypothetical protein
MSAILDHVKSLVRIALYLLVAFMVIQLWQDPAGAAHAVSDNVKAVGSFFASLIDRAVEFARSFTK